jgi:tRNA (guanine-N7-)-methyltransferase
MTQRVIEIKSPHFIAPEGLRGGISWRAVFGNDHPVALEIGCGTGHFIIERASQHPGTNFLAIDIYNKGCWKTCKKIDAEGLGNVRVMRTEAWYLLETGFPAESLAGVYINCPDPWPKKRHRKRRLVNRQFLQAVLARLVPDGDFYFSTDVADYATDVAELLTIIPGFKNRLDQQIVHHLPGYPTSKYMQRFQEMGQPIYFQHQHRDPKIETMSLNLTHQDKPRRGFRSRWPSVHNE